MNEPDATQVPSASKSSSRPAPSASRSEPLLPLGDGPDSDIAPLLLDDPLLLDESLLLEEKSLSDRPAHASGSQSSARGSTESSSLPPVASAVGAAVAKTPVDDLIPLSDLDELPLLPLLDDLGFPEPAAPSEAKRADSDIKPAAVTADDLKLPELDDDFEDLLPVLETLSDDAPPVEAKAAAPKAAEPVAPKPPEPKPAEAKAADPKPEEVKPVEAKAPEAKALDAKSAERKAAEPSAEKSKAVEKSKPEKAKPLALKAAEPKAQAAKPAEPKSAATAKPESKLAPAMSPEPKAAAPKAAPKSKNAEPKTPEPNLGELKAPESKALDARERATPSPESKAIDAKASEPKPLDLDDFESRLREESAASENERATSMPPFPPLSLAEDPPVVSGSPAASTSPPAPSAPAASNVPPSSPVAKVASSPAAVAKPAKPPKASASISVSTLPSPAAPAEIASAASVTPASASTSAAATVTGAAPATASATAPISVPTPAMDRDFILRNQIVERYISGKLPIKGATDFEKFCTENPSVLDELGLPERVNAGLRLLEAAGKPEPWQEAPKKFWQKPQLSLGLAGLSLVLLIGVAVLWNSSTAKDARISKLTKHVAEQPLDAATTTRTIRLLPSFKGSSNSPAVVIGGGSAQLADLKLDLSRSAYRSYRITIDRIDQGRVAILQNVGKDSNGHVRIALNTTALGPGNYQFTMEGITWKGETVPEAWITVGIARR